MRTARRAKSKVPEIFPEPSTAAQRAIAAVELEPELCEDEEPTRKPTCREDREARGMAAKVTGSNPHYVTDAKKLKKDSPHLFDKVKAGELTIPQARVEQKRELKREELKAKAESVQQATQPDAPTWEIVRGEVGTDADPLTKIAPGTVRLVFADPPYNIGIDYGEGHDDKQDDATFLTWCERWMSRCRDLLTPGANLARAGEK